MSDTNFTGVDTSEGFKVDGTTVIDGSGNLQAAAGSVGATELATDSVEAAEIAAGAVGTSEIADGTVASGDLAATTIQYAAVSITNAEMLALRAAPKTLVAAPGAGLMLEFVSAILLFDYVGAYTESSDNMAIRYTDGSGTIVSQAIESGGFVDATADTATSALPKIDVISAKTACENQALVLHNTGDGEFGGGNAGNAVRVKVAYRVHTTGW